MALMRPVLKRCFNPLGQQALQLLWRRNNPNPVYPIALPLVRQSVLYMLLDKDLTRGSFWNVNLPHPLVADVDPGIEFCGLDILPHKYNYRKEGKKYVYEGTIHERPRDPGKDVDVCFSGNVSISQVAIQTTAGDKLKK
jgi:broad specificity polyphosphatase/5'/3'-nucleotidase SurE